MCLCFSTSSCVVQDSSSPGDKSNVSRGESVSFHDLSCNTGLAGVIPAFESKDLAHCILMDNNWPAAVQFQALWALVGMFVPTAPEESSESPGADARDRNL